MQAFELFYLLTVVFILIAGISHFVLLILKVERELNISFMLVTLPAIIAYGLGAVLFFQISAYWFAHSHKKKVKIGLGFAALFILAIGSLITQLMLALKFDLVKNYTFTQSLLPVLIAFVIASLILIVNIYIGAKLAFPFLTKKHVRVK